MTGKYMLDVFGGSGFFTKATNHLGLRGYVLDSKFGPRYDVTQPLVLTRIRQDVSAGTCFAGMISPPRQHTSCSLKVISASAIANLLNSARMLLMNTCVNRGCGTCRKSRCGTSHGLGTSGCVFGSPSGSEHRFWSGTWTIDICTVLLVGVLEQVIVAVCVCVWTKHVHPKASASRSEFCSSRDHTRSGWVSLLLRI